VFVVELVTECCSDCFTYHKTMLQFLAGTSLPNDLKLQFKVVKTDVAETGFCWQNLRPEQCYCCSLLLLFCSNLLLFMCFSLLCCASLIAKVFSVLII